MRTSSLRQPKSVLRHSPLIAAIALALIPAAASAGIKTWDVGPVSNPTAVPVIYTLEQALSLMSSDASCNVDDQVINFTGPFTIQPGSSLPSVTCDRTTINANQISGVVIDGATYYGGTCVLVGSASTPTVIHKLTIQNFSYGTAFCGLLSAFGNTVSNVGTGFDASSGSEITGNTVTDHSNNGVFSYGGATIKNNTIVGRVGATSSGGIYASDSVISGNKVSQNQYGLHVNGGSANGNEVFNNAASGIYATNAASLSGNDVYGNDTGIELYNAGAVSGNRIGSIAGVGPNTVGIFDYGFMAGTVIESNQIAGNVGAGIKSDAYGTIIRNNTLGTATITNEYGINLSSFAYGLTITGNDIAGNTTAGIFASDIFQVDILSNTIAGNDIGVKVECGGPMKLDGNVISGNTSHGVYLAGYQGNGASDITGNRIGVAAGSLTALSNKGSGVMLDAGIVCGAKQMRSGELAMKPLAAALAAPKGLRLIDTSATNNVLISGNIIAFNDSHGVTVVAGVGNSILQNRIWANGRVAGKNIDLGDPSAPIGNDLLDADTGPNEKQNSPVIDAVRHLPSNETLVTFTLESEPADATGCSALPQVPPASGYTYRIDLFENAALTVPAGQAPVGNTFMVGPPCGGPVSGSLTLGGLRDNISATARNEVTLDSSEFSALVAAVQLPNVDIAPTSLSFGQVPLGNTASPQTINISSTGGSPYQISSFTSTPSCSIPSDRGPKARSKAATTIAACTSPFTCTTTCSEGVAYPNGPACSIDVQFSPLALGTVTQTLYICDNVSGSPRPLTFSGQGMPAAVVTVTPTPFDFGSVRVGVKSGVQSFSIVNANATPMALGIIAVTGDFVLESHNCPATLAPGAGCQALVSFFPTISGIANGKLNVPAGAGAGLSTGFADLRGNGVQVAEIVLPTSIDFGTYTLGSPAITRTVTFTNTGNLAVAFTSIAASAPFTLSDGCGATLAPAASCTLLLGFAPATQGTFTGSLTVASNAQGGSGSVLLTGTAQVPPAPLATLSSSTLNLGAVPLGQTTTEGTITVTSTGTADYVVTRYSVDAACSGGSVCATGEFTCSLGCTPGQAYAPGASCTIGARFSPLALGARSSTFYICDNTSASPRAITFTGDGLPAAVVTVSPTPFDFGSVRLGVKSNFQQFSIVNDNASSMPLGTIAVTGDFILESHNCPGALAPGAGCQALVSFLPGTPGIANGRLNVPAGAGAGLSSAYAELRGNGVQLAEIVLPASVDFGAYTLGSPAITRAVTFTNTGNFAVAFSSITASAPFTLSDGCGPSLAPGASCTLLLGFAPGTVGTFAGSLTVASNAQGGSGSVPLTGTAQVAPVPLATLSTSTLNLGATPLGQTTAEGSITVTSTGTANYVVTRYSTDAACTGAAVCATGEFTCSFGCAPGQPYAPGASCTIAARFTPQALGVRSTTFYICDNTTSSPRAVTLTGEGGNPTVVTIQPSSHDFGTVLVGQTSDVRAFTIVNSGGAPVPVGTPGITTGFAIVANNCPATLAASQRCTVAVVFQPTFGGAATGKLIVQAGAGLGLSNAIAELKGTGGTQPGIDLPTAIDFGASVIGSGPVVRTATLANTGNATLTILSVAISGAGFTLQNDCPASVPAGGNCALRITFTATGTGEFTGQLVVTSNAGGAPRTVALSARSQPLPIPQVRVTPAAIGFGDRMIGTLGTGQRVTISNVGGAPAALDRVAVDLHYVITGNTCGASIAAQQSCILEVSFRPLMTGPRAATLQIFTNAEGSPHTVSLAGRGCTPPRPRQPPSCTP